MDFPVEINCLILEYLGINASFDNSEELLKLVSEKIIIEKLQDYFFKLKDTSRLNQEYYFNKYCEVSNQLHDIVRQMKEIEMKSEYLKYARENKLNYKSNLIEVCNLHHQKKLKSKHDNDPQWVFTALWFGVSPVLDDDNLVPSDILQFDITHKTPYGELQKN